MRHDLLFFVSISSVFALTSCASASALSTTAPAAIVHAVGAPKSGALPPRAIPGEHHTSQPPAAHDAPASKQQAATRTPAAPAATPLPPTPLPVTPAATSTHLPVVNLPSSNAAKAPEVPNRLLIPAINLDVPIVAVGWSVSEQDGQPISQWDVPNWRAAGWLNTSALVGAPGNTVLEGHQDIDGRVFEDLEYLKEGDEIQVQAASQIRKYVIALRTIVPEKDQPLEVRRENARWIGRSNDERLTLVTCWPRNDNTHRLILVALPAP